MNATWRNRCQNTQTQYIVILNTNANCVNSLRKTNGIWGSMTKTFTSSWEENVPFVGYLWLITPQCRGTYAKFTEARNQRQSIQIWAAKRQIAVLKMNRTRHNETEQYICLLDVIYPKHCLTRNKGQLPYNEWFSLADFANVLSRKIC